VLEGVLLALSPLGICSMLAGGLVGLIIGMLPGLGPVFGVALLLPFTFWLPAHLGLVFLASLYSCCVYSGSIPAVLLGIPGTTGSITTVFDGHEMAKQGRAGVALGLSATSSMIGGLVGAVSLGALAPLLAELALTFSPADFFALAVLGLSMVAVASRGDTLKGLVLGALGILLSTIGVDRITGDDRFTFGIDYLSCGIPFVPAVVGLFALSQAFVMAEKGDVVAEPGRVTGHVSEGVLTTIRHPFVVLKNALLGVVLGVIPGVGINITNFTAYLLEKSASKEPESFGRGNPLGVIAPETANNACVSAELVPAFALGIPGGATSAIFLAAMNVYGLRPGYAFFSEAGPVAWALIAGLFFAQFIFFVAGVLGAGWFAKVTLVPPAILVPVIMALSFIGGIVDRSMLADVAIVLLFGVTGYILQKGKFPVACLILGMILGPLMEDNFYRALIISQNEMSIFFESPISIAIWAVTLLAFAWGLLPISRWLGKGRAEG
jgi:putative tricarboxylic transport membrane protein